MTAPTLITGGSRATDGTQGINADLRIRDVSDMIHLLEPNSNPLTLLLAKAGKKSSHNVKTEWFERERTPTEDTLDGAIANGTDTTVSVDNGAYVPINSFIRIQETGEQMRVTNVVANDLTVVRGWGSTAGVAASDGASYTIFGGGAAENAQSEEPRSVKAVTQYNLHEIKRDPFGVSNTLKASDLYGGDDLVNLRKERGIEHEVYKEKVAFFGERAEDVSGSYPIRSAGGLQEWITTNAFDYVDGAITLEEVFDFAELAFRYPNETSTKFYFMPRAAASNISLLAEATGALRVMSPAKTFGINMTRLITAHGEWNIVAHPLLEGDTWGKLGFSVHLPGFKYSYLQGRDTMLKQNIQQRGQDGVEEEYLTEFSFQRIHERNFAVSDNMNT